MNILFVNGVFPQLSQTFVLEQINQAENFGHNVEVVSKRTVNGISHPIISNRQLYTKLYSPRLSKKRKVKALFKASLKEPAPLKSWFRKKIRNTRDIKFPLQSHLLSGQIKNTPDIMLVNFGINIDIAARLRRNFYPDAKIGCVFHGFDVTSFPKENGWGYYQRYGKEVDIAFSVNEIWKDALVESNVFDKVEVLHLGVDLEKLKFQERKKHSPFRLLFVGRFVEKKGVKYIIHALDKLRDLNIQAHFVGDGPEFGKMVRLAKKIDLHNVIFYGAKEHEFALNLMKKCDCFVAPSVTAKNGDKEGIPIVLMEAMALGTPVISTFHSGIPELIEDKINGRLVAEHDLDALVMAIRRCAEGEEYRGNARNTIESSFDVSKQCNLMFSKLEAML